MPIKIPAGLPAVSILEGENVSTIEEERALHQDIRPLQVAVLNLMPTKIETETQLIRLLSHNSLQIELTLLTTASHQSTHVPPEHMKSFYKTFDKIKDKKFDGLLITGAPVEELEFEDVDYWRELTDIMKWSNTNVFSTFHICWAAQAALYYYYGIEKYKLEEKLFGVYKHKIRDKNHPLLRGFDDVFYAPHSRHTDIHTGDIEREENLSILSDSADAGAYIIADKNGRRFYITGHSEYDTGTLAAEYFRDQIKGLDIKVPYNYFPDDDPGNKPKNVWRSHANLLYNNWLNYCVYQLTPYNLDDIN